LQRGELRVSQRFLSRRWNWSRSRVTRFLEALEEEGAIIREAGVGRKPDHISLCNYDLYQDQRTTSGPVGPTPWDTNESTNWDTNESTTEPHNSMGEREIGETVNHKRTADEATSWDTNESKEEEEEGGKEEETPEEEILTLRSRYTPEQLKTVDAALDAFRSTRKTGRMADSIVLRELTYWQAYEPAQVIQALQTYLQKGKDERYLRGILRGVARNGSSAPSKTNTSGALERPTLTSWEPPE
jgi:DNA-binding transcriptional MocR family regulator